MKQFVAPLAGQGDKMNQVAIQYLIRLLIASGDRKVGKDALNRAAKQLVDANVNSLGVLEFCRKEGWTNLSDEAARPLITDWEVSQHEMRVSDSGHDTAVVGIVAELVQAAPLELSEIGSYKIMALVGKGGFGRVYKATHNQLPGLYVIKFINGDDPEVLERFRQEAATLRLIKHPNCVGVFEVELDHEPPYMVMEWVGGGKFDEVVQTMLQNDRLVGSMRLFRDLCNGAYAVHLAGIVHRDIKPDNVLVVMALGTERPVLLDPMPKFMAEDNEDDSVLGTPHFMAPEQITNEEPVSESSDVYSLGATLYKALTRKTVHDGASSMDVMSNVIREEGVPKHVAAELRKVIKKKAHADRIVAIISKCLERYPSKRYRDAGEVSKAVIGYLDFVHYEELKQERSRRHRFWWLVLALLLSIVGGSFVYERTNRDRLRKAEDARQATRARDEEKKRADAHSS